ncbi:putative ATPase [Paenibacillus phyllosphaerae]|uniref:Putative ATPase n=1 Tax=Paenibacillus phyllosphaerae TaxID=274593 RepID=A0A7W5FQX8_9BACL|nr:AAA family ATPase [Paenibacillus phyllosphaerae]MBB3113773.1 putative ATPase [Paenibacillus phyllosphaerae]
MKITKMRVENFRLLKSFELDLEKELSLVIGKNNCGKTSLLSILDKFIGSKAGSNAITLDDFNIDFQKELKGLLESGMEEADETYLNSTLGISLFIFIEYDKSDNLSNISRLMLDLDPNNNIIALKFEYKLSTEDFRKMRLEYIEYKDNYKLSPDHISEFMKANYRRFFRLYKRSIGFDVKTSTVNENEYIDLVKEKIVLYRPQLRS